MQARGSKISAVNRIYRTENKLFYFFYYYFILGRKKRTKEKKSGFERKRKRTLVSHKRKRIGKRE